MQGAPTQPPSSGSAPGATPVRGVLLAPSAELALHVVSGPDAGVAVQVQTSPVSMGRGRENTLCIADLAMSRKHAVIERTAEGWYLRDLGSNNGTLLNGVRVQSAFLAEGDVIGIGDTQISVERHGGEPSNIPAPPPTLSPLDPDATRPKAQAPRVSAARVLWPYFVGAAVAAVGAVFVVATIERGGAERSAELARLQVEQGLVRMARGDWRAAADHFQVALKLDARNAVASRNLARAQMEANCSTLVSPALALVGEFEFRSAFDALAGVSTTCAGSKSYAAAKGKLDAALQAAPAEIARLEAAGQMQAAALLRKKVSEASEIAK